MADRVENWDVKLVAFAREALGQPFEWGDTDCVTIARRALAVVWGGADVLPAGRWTTKRGALRRARDLDVQGELEGWGWQPVGAPFATTGDLVVGGPEEDELGVVAVGVMLPRRQVLISEPSGGVRAEPLAALGPRDFYRFFGAK